MNDVRNDINFRYSHWRKLHSSFRRTCFEILGLKKCPPDPSSLAYKHPELRSLVPQSPVYLHDFSFVRCGLSGKNKLSYEKFLGAFQDQRLTGYGRVTLDTPGKVFTPVLFERHDSLSPEAAINRLRNKIGENPETVQRVSPILSPTLWSSLLSLSNVDCFSYSFYALISRPSPRLIEKEWDWLLRKTCIK